MQINFLYHVLASWLIFYLLTAGGKFYVKFRGSVDFSYLAIVIFGAYAGALLNIHRWWDMLSAMWGAFVLSLFFTFFVLYLSAKLDGLYFAIGTLTFYILLYQMAFNLDRITNGAFGLSGMSRTLPGGMVLWKLVPYLWFVAIICVFVVIGLLYIKRTYLFKVLHGRAEREVVLKSLGVRVQRYKFVMIVMTTFLAVLWGNLYSFYYLFIDPNSFWLPMLVLLLVLLFGSYKFNEIGTMIFCICIIALFEYLRMFKVVDPSQIGYFREMVFSFITLIISFWVFRTTNFGRET